MAEGRARTLIDRLGLKRHPEGGYFREVYKSASAVQPLDDRADRASLTSIYFLLAAGQHSRWHRVRSDEAWHFYEGHPIELLLLDPLLREATSVTLGPIGAGRPVHVVPAGWWQAATPSGDYGLVGCTVAPGFEFEDFEFLRRDAARVEALRALAPHLVALV